MFIQVGFCATFLLTNNTSKSFQITVMPKNKVVVTFIYLILKYVSVKVNVKEKY